SLGTRCSAARSRPLRGRPSLPPRRSSDLPRDDADTLAARRLDDAADELVLVVRAVVKRRQHALGDAQLASRQPRDVLDSRQAVRSEEHTSELQSREKLVCRLLLEKKSIVL